MAEVTGMTPARITQEINEEFNNLKSYVDNATPYISGNSTNAHKYVKLNSEGRLYIASGTIVNLSDPVNKAYVDDGLSKKADTTHVNSKLSEKADKTYVDTLSPLKSFVGTGFPEGKVSAPVGSIYTDTASTNGAIRWVKESGTGNTGWRVEYGDTGWREISGLLLNGWTATSIFIRRINYNVVLRYSGLTGDNATSPRMIQLSTGFYTARSRLAFTGNGAIFTSQITSSGELDIVTSFSVPDNVYYSETTWVTTGNWPSSLPGTPS